MAILGESRRRAAVVLASVAVMATGGVGLAIASTSSSSTPSNARSHGRGINEFGNTRALYRGHKLHFSYTKGYYCDTKVHSTASSKCEGGAKFKKAPAKHFDPLYITVPLGFNRPAMKMECPAGLVCVDHPGTIDLRRIKSTLKPLYPSLTNKQLTHALRNFAVPGHDHFITDTNSGKPEWWDVKIIGVTNKAVYNRIVAHQSFGYIHHLLKTNNKNVAGPVPTNMFLYFAARG